MIKFIFALLCLVGFVVCKTLAATRREADDTRLGLKVGGWVLLFLAVLGIGTSVIRVVPANSVGIPVNFGSIGKPMGSGPRFTAPWTKIHNFSTRLQELSMLSKGEGGTDKSEAISVRGSDGYEMFVDSTIRYYVDQKVANDLFKRVGSMEGVRDRIVLPEVREGIRIIFARYTAEEGYSIQREKIAGDVTLLLRERLAPYGVNLDSALIRSVDPEPKLTQAIGDRAAARERALQAEIEQRKLVTESETRKQVAERDATAAVTKAQGQADAQRISAQGEADANTKISASLTDDLIRMAYTEALKAGTVFVVPDGASFILGSDLLKK